MKILSLFFTLIFFAGFANAQGIVANENFKGNNFNFNDAEIRNENNCNILFEKLNNYGCQSFLDRPFIYINSSEAQNLMCMRIFEIYLVNNCDRNARRIIKKQKNNPQEKITQKVITEENNQKIEESTPDGTICGKEKYADLIGKNQKEIQLNKIEEPFRIICNDCPYTMDFSPARINFHLDEKENVKSISCG